MAAILGAQKTITFETYIYWSEAIGKEFADALAEKARAGVKVQIITPGKNIDTETVRHASRWDRDPLSVGSINFDDRSFRLNDEANLNIYDADFARG